MVTSVAEHTNCTVDPEHTVMFIGVRVNAKRVAKASVHINIMPIGLYGRKNLCNHKNSLMRQNEN